MSIPSHYKTLGKPGTSSLKERNSKFYGYAFNVKDSSEIEGRLFDCKVLHPTATHYCYAWKLDDNNIRVNDDGEPGNSAGQPIYRQILSYGLSAILIIVVRYYGGKKLGVPGLIASYGECAKLAIDDALIVELEVLYELTVRDINKNDFLIYSFVKRYNGTIVHKQSQLGSYFGLGFPMSSKALLQEALKELPNFDWKEGLPES